MEQKAFIVRVSPALHRAVKIKSITSDKPVNVFLSEKLAEWVKEEQPPAAAQKAKGAK